MTTLTATQRLSLVPLFLSRRDAERRSGRIWTRTVAPGLLAAVGRRKPSRPRDDGAAMTTAGIRDLDLLSVAEAEEAAVGRDPLEAAVEGWSPILAHGKLVSGGGEVLKFAAPFLGQPACVLDREFLKRIFAALGRPVLAAFPAVDEALFRRPGPGFLARFARFAASRCTEACEPLSGGVYEIGDGGLRLASPPLL